MSSILQRLLPIVFAAMALTALAHAPATAATTPDYQVCGNVDLGSTNNDDATKAFDCFTTAFRGCVPAELVATGRDGDADVAWTFLTVAGEQGCSVFEIVQRASGSTTTTDTYSCGGVSRDKDGLRVTRCGAQGDVAVRPIGTLGAAPTATVQSQQH